MRIIKFNEASSEGQKPHELALSELNLSVKDMEAMLYKLNKYKDYLASDGRELISDLESAKGSGWTKLRKWKIENILSRYEVQKVKINEVDDIGDYLLEVEDEGWEVKIQPNSHTIDFSTEGHPIKKLAALFHFLDSNHRLGFILQGVDNNRGKWEVKVKYKIRTGEGDNKKEEDMEEEETNRARNLLYGMFQQTQLARMGRQVCTDCDGTGTVDGDECRNCNGYGYVNEDDYEVDDDDDLPDDI
jgi:hypothetical protein